MLKNARIGVFALNGDGGYPYAIPMNFLYDEKNNSIYMHSAKIGHKVDSLKSQIKFVLLSLERRK